MSCYKLVLTTCCLGMTSHHDRAWAADARGTAEPAFKNVPTGQRVVMVALGRQQRRRAEQPARCSWTPRISQKVWLAGVAAVGAAGEG